MRYPQLSNFLSFIKIDDDHYKVRNFLEDHDYHISSQCYKFIRMLDGKTDPYKLQDIVSKDEITEILHALEERFLLRDSRFLYKGFDCFLYSLFMVKNSTSKYRHMAKIIHNIIRLTYLPLLFIGYFFFKMNTEYMNTNVNHMSLAVVIAIITTIFFHEMGHGISVVAYGGILFEFGVGFSYLLPIGYTAYDDDNLSPYKRIQIASAGIKVNLLVCGISLLLGATIFQNIAGYFLFIANNNFFGCLINLLPLSGLDGSEIVLLSLGIEGTSFFKKGLKIVFKKEIRKKLFKDQGLAGYAIFLFSLIYILIQPVIILYLIMNSLLWGGNIMKKTLKLCFIPFHLSLITVVLGSWTCFILFIISVFWIVKNVKEFKYHESLGIFYITTLCSLPAYFKYIIKYINIYFVDFSFESIIMSIIIISLLTVIYMLMVVIFIYAGQIIFRKQKALNILSRIRWSCLIFNIKTVFALF